MKRAELERVLTENIPDLEGKCLWIWGTGNTACLYQEGLSRIEFGSRIEGYVDSDMEKWKGGGIFMGSQLLVPAC